MVLGHSESDTDPRPNCDGAQLFWLKSCVVSSFCIPGKPSHGTQGMEFSPDFRWMGPNHSKAPTQIREVASSKPTSIPPTVQGGPNRGRWRNSPSVDTKVRSIQAALAALDAEETSECTGRAPGGAPTCQSSITAFGTILPKSRHHNGGSSVEGVQVGRL